MPVSSSGSRGDDGSPAVEASEHDSARVPGDLLLHPVAIMALVLVIFNDRVLKVDYPSELSGKLSDFAGLVYFPLFAVAAVEALRWLVRRNRWELTSRAVVNVAVVTGLIFVAIKVWYPAGEAYRSVMGAVMYPISLAGNLVRGDGVPELARVALVADRFDLLAIPVLLLPVWVARRVMDASSIDPTGI